MRETSVGRGCLSLNSLRRGSMGPFRSLLVLASLLAVPALHAQSTLYRSPNLEGTWTADPGVLQFNFVHRFYVAAAQSGHKVVNLPTFTLAAGLGQDVDLGLRYASNSSLVRTPFRPNEAELFGRWHLVGHEGAEGFGAAITPAYNTAARSFDSELGLDYTAGPLTVLGAARYAGNAMGLGTARGAVAGGFAFRLNSFVGISA